MGGIDLFPIPYLYVYVWAHIGDGEDHLCGKIYNLIERSERGLDICIHDESRFWPDNSRAIIASSELFVPYGRHGASGL